MNEERSSDPFPFLKIHRTVEALAEAVSTGFGIPIEKAGWGLMRFWRRCADPREIEAAYERGDRWVFLDDETLSRRLLLTFGKDLDHLLLAEAGVVEKVDGKWRVKGTSDFFAIIDEQRRAKETGALGGRLSAEKRKGKAPSRPPSQLDLETPRGPQQESRDETLDGKTEDETKRSASLSGTVLWKQIEDVYDAFDIPPPEIHPRERNDRLKTIVAQLPRERLQANPLLVAQVFWAAIERFPKIREAENPLGYLQRLLKDESTRVDIFAKVDELKRERPAA